MDGFGEETITNFFWDSNSGEFKPKLVTATLVPSIWK
jgi:hypothetical protein